MVDLLWFDVESRYEATVTVARHINLVLWFDVESRYEATVDQRIVPITLLWFDVESRYEATPMYQDYMLISCGLM